jgi:hypothetical protein
MVVFHGATATAGHDWRSPVRGSCQCNRTAARGSLRARIGGVERMGNVLGSTSWLFTDALVRTDAEQVLLRADEDLSLRNGR